MTEHFERQAERQKKRTDEDYDEGTFHDFWKFNGFYRFLNVLTVFYIGVEEQLEDEDEEDVYTLSKMGDLIHALFSTHKEAFLPVFDQLLPYFSKLLETTHPWSDHQWGICIFDDLVEYGGPNSLNYQQHFVQQVQ